MDSKKKKKKKRMGRVRNLRSIIQMGLHTHQPSLFQSIPSANSNLPPILHPPVQAEKRKEGEDEGEGERN